eukprot:1780715-Pyramimonas_sp.AAC.1
MVLRCFAMLCMALPCLVLPCLALCRAALPYVPHNLHRLDCSAYTITTHVIRMRGKDAGGEEGGGGGGRGEG